MPRWLRCTLTLNYYTADAADADRYTPHRVTVSHYTRGGTHATRHTQCMICSYRTTRRRSSRMCPPRRAHAEISVVVDMIAAVALRALDTKSSSRFARTIRLIWVFSSRRVAGVSRDLRARRPVLRHFLSWRPSRPGLQRNDDSSRQLRMTATMERPFVRRSISINQPHSIGAQVTHCACSYSCWCCVISVRHRAIISLLCRSRYDHVR